MNNLTDNIGKKIAKNFSKNFSKNVKLIVVAAICLITLFVGYNDASAFAPKGRDLGVGLVLGDPTGATVKFWDGKDVAYNVYVGNSFFGEVAIGADYIKHFNTFESRSVNMHLAGGLVVGVGNGGNWWRRGKNDDFYYRDGGGVGIGGRAMMGVNFVPGNTPFELTLQAGPFVGMIPNFGFGFVSDFSVRVYL